MRPLNTPGQAAEATKTYAALYIDVRRRRSDADLAAAAEAIRRKIDQVTSQLGSAVEPQRASLVEVLGFFTERLDQLQGDQSLTQGPEVVGLTPDEPVECPLAEPALAPPRESESVDVGQEPWVRDATRTVSLHGLRTVAHRAMATAPMPGGAPDGHAPSCGT